MMLDADIPTTRRDFATFALAAATILRTVAVFALLVGLTSGILTIAEARDTMSPFQDRSLRDDISALLGSGTAYYLIAAVLFAGSVICRVQAAFAIALRDHLDDVLDAIEGVPPEDDEPAS